VERIGVFGDAEVCLDFTPWVREERPVGADSCAIFSRLGDVVGADRDQPAIRDLEFTMELNQPFRLPAVLWSVTPATEDEDQGVLSLQFGELPVFRGVVGQLIVWEDSPRNNVRSHLKSSGWMRVGELPDAY
jgi:hypothetical protein